MAVLEVVVRAGHRELLRTHGNEWGLGTETKGGDARDIENSVAIFSRVTERQNRRLREHPGKHSARGTRGLAQAQMSRPVPIRLHMVVQLASSLSSLSHPNAQAQAHAKRTSPPAKMKRILLLGC